MNDDSQYNAFFNAGAYLDTAPSGDAARQAVASLGGYVYQVAVSTLAWLDLPEGGRVFLEVAEDYATVASQALSAVQVKETAGSGSVTLNKDSVRDAVDSFVDLVARNPDRQVELRYLTTSPLGTERRLDDRPAGHAGLVYWRKAAAGAEVGPLRHILISEKFSARVRTFVQARDDDALRSDLLQRIHWDCGKPDLSAVIRELRERLIVLTRDRFHLPAAEAQPLSDTLMCHVLRKSILKDSQDRVLSQAELYTAIDAAARVSVPRSTIESMGQLASALSGALVSGTPLGTAFAADEVGWLIDSGDLPAARGTISRVALEPKVEDALKNHGASILIGGSGLGKSLLARSVARGRGAFVIVDLRDLDPPETRRRLDFVFARVGAIAVPVVVFEDLNHFEDTGVTLSFARVLSALHRRDRVAIVTSYRKPSDRSLVELGHEAGILLEVPYFSEAEAAEVVRASNGSSDTWGRIAYVVGAQGHPQLVHAFVMGMKARRWPTSELRDVVIRGLSSDEVDTARDAARRTLAAGLPNSARSLLYRLSMALGRFDRALALSIGALSPAIPHAGESLDELIGPWIEGVGRNVYRVSPLASRSGAGSLTGDEQQAIHNLVAMHMLARRTIDASDASVILAHALAGKSEQGLVGLANSVLTCEQETLRLLAEHFFLLRLFHTGTPIYPDNPTISGMLRLAQFRLMAAGGRGTEISDCIGALRTETSSLPRGRIRDMFEAVSLSTILATLGIADRVADWVTLLRSFRELVEANADLCNLKRTFETAPGSEGISFYGLLFSIGATGISSVERLEEVINDLARLEAGEREMWMEAYRCRPSDFAVLVNGPWSSEDFRDVVKPVDAAERYKRMAEQTEDWGIRALSLQLYIARGVMLDEYCMDRDAALAALDDAASRLGDDIVLQRARAKIHWRDNNHVEAVRILSRIAHQVGLDNPVERAFAMREAAISAAKTDDWQKAEEWFLEGKVAAAQAESGDMQAMAIGLGVDAAVAALKVGAVDRALRGLVDALIALRSLDPEVTLRAAYCHRVVRHTVLWTVSQIDGSNAMIGGKPIDMLPGTCSNPEPVPAIRGLQLGPIDFAWYMLAEAEISSGIDAGILTSLRERLTLAPIPMLEVDLRSRLLAKDIHDLDSSQFANHFWKFIEGMAFFRSESERIRDAWNVFDPERGEIPPLARTGKVDAWGDAVAVDAVLAFCTSAVLVAKPEGIDALEDALLAEFGDGYPGESAFSHWHGRARTLSDLDRIIADSIIQLRRRDGHIGPRSLWNIGLRLFEKARQSNFKRFLTLRIADWLRSEWRRIISDERFRLSRPVQTVPAIEVALGNTNNDEAFVARLLLASADAVVANLGKMYRDLLEAIASGAISTERASINARDALKAS